MAWSEPQDMLYYSFSKSHLSNKYYILVIFLQVLLRSVNFVIYIDTYMCVCVCGFWFDICNTAVAYFLSQFIRLFICEGVAITSGKNLDAPFYNDSTSILIHRFQLGPSLSFHFKQNFNSKSGLIWVDRYQLLYDDK